MFLSKTDERARMQAIVPYDPVEDAPASFGEAFAAGVGQVIDEEMSISAQLNMEGYAQRSEIANQLKAEGFDLSPYTDRTGAIDYNRLAQDTDRGIKTDIELYEERNAELARRREYAQDVMERGSGFAQFAGSMTAYMLDPVNVVTLPLGASASALRGLSTMAAMRRVALTEAAIGAGAEMAIQPLVYAHKNEIGSPYEVDDALLAIGTAALGGAAIGGAASGVAGLFRQVAKMDAPDLPAVRGAREILNRHAADLELNPDRGVARTNIDAHVVRFQALDTQTIKAEIKTLRESGDVLAAEVAEAVVESRKGRWGRNVDAEVAEGGAPPGKKLQEKIDRIAERELVKTDIEYMRKLEAERAAANGKVARADDYAIDHAVDADDIDALYDADMAEFEATFADSDGMVVLGVDEAGAPNQVSARKFMQDMDADIDGLESVRVCAIG